MCSPECSAPLSPAPPDLPGTPLDLGAVAATGVWLHGRAAARAAAAVGDGPITALDLAEALPPVVAEALARE